MAVDIKPLPLALIIILLLQVKEDIVARGETLALASFTEATVSVLLKHLDRVGISKTYLEEVLFL